MADYDKIRRNVQRMVDANAPEADIDAYLGTESVTPEQLRAAPKGKAIDRNFGGDADLQKQYAYAKKFTSPTQRRVLDSATLGSTDEIMAGLGAVAAVPFSDRSLSDNYSRQLQVQRALRDDARSELSGPAGFAADLVGGFVALPGRVASTAKAVAPIGTETWRQGLSRLSTEAVQAAPHLAKVGAGYGATNALLGTDGSSDPNAGILDHFAERLSATPAGALEGAAGALVFGTGLKGALGVRDIRRGQVADRIDRQRLNALDWQAEGQTAPGYVITESPSVRATAPSLADSIVGGSLRNDAASRTAALEASAQQRLRAHTEGASSNDLGESLQQSLNKNLRQYTIPNRELEQMPNSALERMTGDVTAEGFRPPRPRVDPVQPREVPEITPEQFAAEGLPSRVPAVEPAFNTPPRRDFGDYSPELIVRDMDLQVRAENFNAKYNSGSAKGYREIPNTVPTRRQDIELDIVAKKHDEILNKYVSKFPELARDRNFNSDYMEAALRNDRQFAADYERMQRLRERHSKLKEELAPIRSEHAALLSEREKLAADKEAYADEQFRAVAKKSYEKSVSDAKAETLRRNAAAETAARREQARLDADSQTRAAQEAAERAYEQELANSSNGFRVGRTGESYPTEFAAGYERVSRETPTIQRNILGGKNETTPTATESLLYEFAEQARRQNQAVGYRNGQLFGVDGSIMHPGVSAYLEKALGPEVAGQLQSYAARRTKGGFNPAIEGVRDLRTAVRRAAQDAERGLAPGESRTTDAAMLRRLEGAISEDMHQFLRDAGPQGERASQMMRGVDQEYRNVAEGLRRPLGRLFGDKVTPIEAMDRLARAAENGDTRTLGAFMRVMSEKDNPTRAAAAIVAHMTEGAANLQTFLRGYGGIPADSRNVLFRGSEGAALRSSLDRLERMMGDMRRYQVAVTNGGGIDFTRRVNLLIGASAVAHPVNAMFLAGGASLVSKFMTSARYVNWLTTLPRASNSAWTSGQAMNHIARLTAIANSDPDRERGRAILSAAGDMVLPSKAKAAPVSPSMRAGEVMKAEPVLFAGPGAKTADANALETAKQAPAESADATRRATGWFKTNDGKWRYEIDDSGSSITGAAREFVSAARKVTTPREGIQLPLSGVIDHKDMFAAYPKLKNMRVMMFSEKSYPAISPFRAYLDIRSNTMYVNADAVSDDKTFRSTVLHEIQHYIQNAEKFAYGSEGWDTPRYNFRPGEAEASDVEMRRNMTKTDRQVFPPAIVSRGGELDWPSPGSDIMERARKK